MDEEMNVRVERLERDNRRLKVVGTLAAGVLGIAWLLGAAFDDKEKVPDEVRAKEFILVGQGGEALVRLHATTIRVKEDEVIVLPKLVFLGKDGKDRLTLGGGGDLAPYLRMQGSDGVTRLQMDLTEGKTGITLRDKNAKVRATFAVNAEGQPFLGLHDEQERLRIGLAHHSDGSFLVISDGTVPRATVGVTPDGAPGVAVNGKDGKPRIFLSVPQDSTPSLSIVDGEGKLHCQLFRDPDQGTGLRLFREGEILALSATVNPTGVPSYVVIDQQGSPRAILTVGPEGLPFLSLMDRDRTRKVTLMSNADGFSGMYVSDENKTLRAALGLRQGASSALQLYDAESNRIWEAPSSGRK
ncbi:MAG: hypothetical protein O7H41_00015 [Planctomycetota bacterium]|nr:hypothetical protein [Planctomycetota bacterium]